jgi:hypothetical protein
LRLADVLALHEGIIEAFIVEEHSGDHVVVDRASRSDSMPSKTLWAKHEQLLLPELVLGAVTQFRRGLSPPKIVGVSYGDMGVLFCHLSDNQTLVLATQPEALSKVMKLAEEYVQKFAETKERIDSNLIKSAIEAEDIVRGYLLNRRMHGGKSISIDEVSYRESDGRWIVGASFTGVLPLTTKHYSVQIDARSGAIMSLAATSASKFRILGLVSLSVGLASLVLLVFLLLAFFAK